MSSRATRLTATQDVRSYRIRHRAHLVECIRLDSVVLDRPAPSHTPPHSAAEVTRF